MSDQKAMAYINMNGVLRAMQYLCELDGEAKAFIKAFDISVQFTVKDGPAARLIFKDGKCVFEKGKGKTAIKLSFSSPEHFNRMMDGKANPMILKGFTKLNFLTKDFMWLSKRLEYFLKPTEESMKTPGYKEINTILTFLTAFNSMAEIGMHDPVGQVILNHDRRGVFSASIDNTAYTVRLKMAKGRIETVESAEGAPEMRLAFKDIDKASDLLNGKSDFLSAIGFGDVKISGYMPLMQSVELLVPRVGMYLK
jgi:hypothetical protein